MNEDWADKKINGIMAKFPHIPWGELASVLKLITEVMRLTRSEALEEAATIFESQDINFRNQQLSPLLSGRKVAIMLRTLAADKTPL